MKNKQKSKRIPLTQGKIAIVDAEDYERLNQHKWHALRSGHTYYALRTIKCNGRKTALYMHREIMHAARGMEINHINYNGLDHRKANLRVCTHQQKQFTQKPARNKTSILKGVSWHNHINKWQVRIKYSQRSYHLGYFDDEIEAAKAYDEKAMELFGEFAYLNFPEERAA